MKHAEHFFFFFLREVCTNKRCLNMKNVAIPHQAELNDLSAALQ